MSSNYINIPIERGLFEELWRKKREAELCTGKKLSWTQFLKMYCSCEKNL